MTSLTQLFPPARNAEVLARTERFWAGEGRCLVTVTTSAAPYRQVEDEQRMLELCAENLRSQAALPGDNLPTFFPDFGTISTVRHWGGHELRGEGGKPHIEPIASTIEEVLAAKQVFTVDDPRSDTARALRMWRELRARHGNELWLRCPDMQGTLTTAALLIDQTAFMTAMLDQPEAVHVFLDRICTHLIAYQRHIRSGSQGRLVGSIWPFVNLPESAGISLTEDYMPLLSPALYREFSLPYLKRISEAFGGVQIHCCGKWGRHVPALAKSGIRIRAVEFHHAYTSVAEVAPLAEQGVVLIPFMSSPMPGFASTIDYYRHLLATTPWRYAFPLDDSPASLAFARELAASDAVSLAAATA